MLNALSYDASHLSHSKPPTRFLPVKRGQCDCGYQCKLIFKWGCLNVRGAGGDGGRCVCIRGPGALVYLPYGPHYNEEAL